MTAGHILYGSNRLLHVGSGTFAQVWDGRRIAGGGMALGHGGYRNRCLETAGSPMAGQDGRNDPQADTFCALTCSKSVSVITINSRICKCLFRIRRTLAFKGSCV